jgi:hypothetical protein
VILFHCQRGIPRSHLSCRELRRLLIVHSLSRFCNVHLLTGSAVNQARHEVPLTAQQKSPTNPARGEPDAGSEPQALPVHPWSRRYGYRHCRSGGAQIVCGGLTRPSISHDLERDSLSLVEAVHPGAFDGADMHENILTAVIRLDETEAFLAVEPLYGSLRHVTLLSGTCLNRPRSRAAGLLIEIWKKISPTQARGEAKSFGRNSTYPT